VIRRYWWIVPLAIALDWIIGAILLATVVPWCYATLAAVQAAHR